MLYMEYTVSFADGSTAYLAHHGVKGMHWGVRNAETQAKYAGGMSRRERRFARADNWNAYAKKSVSNANTRTVARATNKNEYLLKKDRLKRAKRSGQLTGKQVKEQKKQAKEARFKKDMAADRAYVNEEIKDQRAYYKGRRDVDLKYAKAKGKNTDKINARYKKQSLGLDFDKKVSMDKTKRSKAEKLANAATSHYGVGYYDAKSAMDTAGYSKGRQAVKNLMWSNATNYSMARSKYVKDRMKK